MAVPKTDYADQLYDVQVPSCRILISVSLSDCINASTAPTTTTLMWQRQYLSVGVILSSLLHEVQCVEAANAELREVTSAKVSISSIVVTNSSSKGNGHSANMYSQQNNTSSSFSVVGSDSQQLAAGSKSQRITEPQSDTAQTTSTKNGGAVRGALGKRNQSSKALLSSSSGAQIDLQQQPTAAAVGAGTGTADKLLKKGSTRAMLTRGNSTIATSDDGALSTSISFRSPTNAVNENGSTIGTAKGSVHKLSQHSLTSSSRGRSTLKLRSCVDELCKGGFLRTVMWLLLHSQGAVRAVAADTIQFVMARALHDDATDPLLMSDLWCSCVEQGLVPQLEYICAGITLAPEHKSGGAASANADKLSLFPESPIRQVARSLLVSVSESLERHDTLRLRVLNSMACSGNFTLKLNIFTGLCCLVNHSGRNTSTELGRCGLI